MKNRIYYTKPSITDLEVEYATDAARNGWGEHCYDYIVRFESAFKAHLCVKHAIATSSCTGALHMGLAALGIGLGDEVILADINWIATAAPITYLGAKPVFVDILPDTWCIDPELAEAAITSKTKAIIATHLYGNLCEMDRLLAIGKKHGIPIIEDAAEAIGSIYHGKRAGSMGAFGTFSFHGTKTITTGEGGMFVTNDDALYERVLTLSNHGRSRHEQRQFWPEIIGFKYKLSNIQAAIGCAQIQRIEELVAKKRYIHAFYENHLKHLDLSINQEYEGVINGCWMPTIVFGAGMASRLHAVLSAMKKIGVDVRPFFHPLSSLGLFGDNVAAPVGRSISSRGLNLPSYHDMIESDLLLVTETLRSSMA